MPERRTGFTLVELLVVITVIGILAAIVIPRFTGSRERAFITTLKADLRNLSSQQEIHHGNQSSYTNDLSVLGFTASSGVAVTVVAADATGWSATATHAGSAETCAVFYGSAAPVAPATSAGVVECSG